jgi:hypothetical protein
MLEFKSKSEHNIKGRGKVFCVEAQSDKSLVGETVIIDDKKYQVTGQEIMGALVSGQNTGLLVREIAEKEIKNKDMTNTKEANRAIHQLIKESGLYPTDVKYETLFDNLETAKQNIAEKFSNEYFDDDYHFYWLGDVLSICDEFIDLENIKYSLENSITYEVLFDYLKKPRNFNLEAYCLGKVGRKEKRKQELIKVQERVELSKKYFEERLDKYIKQEKL